MDLFSMLDVVAVPPLHTCDKTAWNWIHTHTHTSTCKTVEIWIRSIVHINVHFLVMILYYKLCKMLPWGEAEWWVYGLSVIFPMSTSVQFSSVAQLCLTLCNPTDCSTPGFPVHQQLPELAQAQVHRVSDAIQPSHPLSSPSPPAFNLSQHQGLFKWVSSAHQVPKVLEFQLQHQSFQWIFRTHFL